MAPATLDRRSVIQGHGRNRTLDYLREGLVIVGSILLAFGVDAWWDERGDAAQRRALLQGLANDFEVAEQRLDQSRSLHSEVQEVTARWLQLARSDTAPSALAAVADTLVSEMQWTLVTRPPSGTLDALLQSGDLSVLENQELLSALTTWLSVIDYLNDFEETGADQWYDDVTPYLRAAGVPVADLMWTRRQLSNGYPIQPRRTDVYELLSDSEWESIVQARWFIYTDVLFLEARARSELVRIREILEDELRRR